MIDGNPWTTFDAATQLYRDGVISPPEFDAAVVGAFGEPDALLILGAVWSVLDA